jgi:hypothetical protein
MPLHKIQAYIFAVLGLSAVAMVWVIFRAATTQGLLWGVKRFLLLVAAVALLFGGVWGWVRFQQRLPRGVTVASVEASHAALLAKLRDVAREHDLERAEGLSGPEMRDLFAYSEILQASFVLPGGKIVQAFEQSGLRQPRGHWMPSDSGQASLVRGWVVLQGTSVDTLEYLEPAVDANGAIVTIQLTLRLDSFLRPR